MPKPLELTKLTPEQLKNLLTNYNRHGLGQTAMVGAVVDEMARRGIATGREYRVLAWNQDRVRDVMQRFKEVASAVHGNQRTSYTEAGGLKIGRPKDDPERMWIDSYSAIKTNITNAVFVCYIKRPSDEPEFHLYIDGKSTRCYNADHLPDALKEWEAIARAAG